MDAARRRELRAALLAAEPWLAASDVGPRAVDAGPCDRCEDLPRLLPTCGPVPWRALCRRCAAALGADAWCAGHLDDAEAALTWAEELPDHWDVAVTLWWVATGEIGVDSLVDLRDDPRVPDALRDGLAAS